MWSPTRIIVLCLLLSSLFLAGCGYQFAGEGPTVLGNGSNTLKITGVENPTMLPWLPQELRSMIRDEINKRNIARWVDNGTADHMMRIRIISFSLGSSVKDSNSNTLLYSGSLSLEAIVTDGSTNKVIWKSDVVSVSKSFDTNSESTAGRRTAEFAARRLIDQLYEAY